MASINKHNNGYRLYLRHCSPPPRLYLGRLNSRQRREIIRIVEPLELAAKLDPNDPLPHVIASQIYSALLRPEQATREA